MKKILILDDDELILESIQIILQDLGFEVLTHSKSAQGIAAALDQEFDLILTDIRMPHLDGGQVVKKILAVKPAAKILVVTAYPGDPIVQTALTAGALGVMKKPFEVAKIIDFLKD